MKKALVLGVMAVFAINFMTVQNVIAQERGTTKPNKVTVNSKPTTIKADDNTAKTQTLDVTRTDKKDTHVTTTTTSTTAEGKKVYNGTVSANQGEVSSATSDKNVAAAGKPTVKTVTTSTAPAGKKNVTNVTSAKKADLSQAKAEKNQKALGKDAKGLKTDNKGFHSSKHINQSKIQSVSKDEVLKMRPVDLKSKTTTHEADVNDNATIK